MNPATHLRSRLTARCRTRRMLQDYRVLSALREIGAGGAWDVRRAAMLRSAVVHQWLVPRHDVLRAGPAGHHPCDEGDHPVSPMAIGPEDVPEPEWVEPVTYTHPDVLSEHLGEQ